MLCCWTGPALEEAVTPTVGEVIFTILVLAALPACYYYTPAGRRWIMLSFPEETFEGVKDLTVGEAKRREEAKRKKAEPLPEAEGKAVPDKDSEEADDAQEQPAGRKAQSQACVLS